MPGSAGDGSLRDILATKQGNHCGSNTAAGIHGIYGPARSSIHPRSFILCAFTKPSSCPFSPHASCRLPFMEYPNGLCASLSRLTLPSSLLQPPSNVPRKSSRNYGVLDVDHPPGIEGLHRPVVLQIARVSTFLHLLHISMGFLLASLTRG